MENTPWNVEQANLDRSLGDSRGRRRNCADVTRCDVVEQPSPTPSGVGDSYGRAGVESPAMQNAPCRECDLVRNCVEVHNAATRGKELATVLVVRMLDRCPIHDVVVEAIDVQALVFNAKAEQDFQRCVPCR